MILIVALATMSSVKNKLKVARDALSKKDFVQARDAATQVLEYEPDNYNAWVLTQIRNLPHGDAYLSLEMCFSVLLSLSWTNHKRARK